MVRVGDEFGRGGTESLGSTGEGGGGKDDEEVNAMLGNELGLAEFLTLGLSRKNSAEWKRAAVIFRTLMVLLVPFFSSSSSSSSSSLSDLCMGPSMLRSSTSAIPSDRTSVSDSEVE